MPNFFPIFFRVCQRVFIEYTYESLRQSHHIIKKIIAIQPDLEYHQTKQNRDEIHMKTTLHNTLPKNTFFAKKTC